MGYRPPIYWRAWEIRAYRDSAYVGAMCDECAGDFILDQARWVDDVTVSDKAARIFHAWERAYIADGF